MHKRSAIVLFSGGIDSLLCAALAQRDEQAFTALHIRYGQNQAETDAARWLCEQQKWPLTIASVEPFPVSLDPAGTNLIPGRNALFLSVAAAMLPTTGGCIYIGSNKDDYADYPDCRAEFFVAFTQVFQAQGWPISIVHPLSETTKSEIVREAKRRGLPIENAISCYAGSGCGECNACRLRQAAGA